MRTNWPLVAGIVAVLSVPFALAVLEDTAGDEAAGDREPAAERERVTPDPPPPPPAERDEPGARWREVRAMSLDFFDEVFFEEEGASAPALAGPLAGAAFGMSREELARAVPGVLAWVSGGSPRYPELDAALLFEGAGAGLSGVSLLFPDDGTARRVFASRWGAPLDDSGPPNGPRLWLNPDLGVRLALHEQRGRARAELEPYQPLEALVAPENGEALGFERIPLLGASREDVTRAYPDELLAPEQEESALALRLPGSTYSRGPTDVTLELEGERVHELRFRLDCTYAVSCEGAIRSLFERERVSRRGAGGSRLELAWPGRRVTLDMEYGGAGARVRVTPR